MVWYIAGVQGVFLKCFVLLRVSLVTVVCFLVGAIIEKTEDGIKVKYNRSKLLMGIAIFWLAISGVSLHTYASEGELLIAQNPYAPITYTFAEDGVVEKKWEFTIPAQPGENFDVEIVFTGNGGEGEVLDIFYDKVTEDQMVPNVVENADDRSGLLNESVVAGVEQVRKLEIAALDGDIVIRAVGNGRIVSVTVTKRIPNKSGVKATVYTIGDSIVQTYSERYTPQTGWGQTLPDYFDENVNFVNRALGGRSTGNYMRQGRLNEVLCDILPGDYVLIEFGHNDASSGNGDRYVPVSKYKTNLADIYIKAIRDRGATPILVTVCNNNAIHRETGEFIPSYPDYVEAMRQVAEETDTLLVDLNAITVEKFTELNDKWGGNICAGIIYNNALPGIYEGEYANGANDGTHLQRYGAELVAGYIAETLKDMNLKGLSEYYVPAETATEVPAVPTDIAEREYEGSVARITWAPSEGADFYKVLMAKVTPVTAADGSVETYELSGEFELKGYTTVCDYYDRKAVADEHYAYKIVAINEAGESEESEIFSFGLLAEVAESESVNAAVEGDNGADGIATGGDSIEASDEEAAVVDTMAIAWKTLGLFVLSVFGFVGLMVLISAISNRKGTKGPKTDEGDNWQGF